MRNEILPKYGTGTTYMSTHKNHRLQLCGAHVLGPGVVRCGNSLPTIMSISVQSLNSNWISNECFCCCCCCFCLRTHTHTHRARTHTNRLSFTAIHFIHLEFLLALPSTATWHQLHRTRAVAELEKIYGKQSFTTASFCCKECSRKFPHNFKMDWRCECSGGRFVVDVVHVTISCGVISSVMPAHVRHRETDQ